MDELLAPPRHGSSSEMGEFLGMFVCSGGSRGTAGPGGHGGDSGGAGCVKQQKCICSQFWRLEFPDQSASIDRFSTEFASWLAEDQLLVELPTSHPHMAERDRVL